MNPNVDAYLTDGCGRCSHYQTPQCKVNFYLEPLEHLRSILLKTELTEGYKWSQPCYTLNGNNVLLLTAFKDYCCLAFFKGALMKDEHQLMMTPGENSQAVRQLRFTDAQQVMEKKSVIENYVREAIELEKSGAQIDFKEKDELVYPDELLDKLGEDPAFKKAFEGLTAGRKRGYNLYFSAPKQSKTRISRIEKYLPKIMEGKGFHDR